MKKNKPKKSLSSWLIIVFYALIGVGCGAFFLVYLDRAEAAGVSNGQRLWSLALMLVCLYGALFLQIVIHEAGHLVFGLLTGYRFCSFRIFNLMWVKENGRIRLRRMSIAGTGGQCLMGPPDLKDGTMPVMLYNFGGAIFHLLFALLALGLSFLCPLVSMLRVFLGCMAVTGVGYALLHGLPLPIAGLNNDGQNALALSKSKEAVRAFWIQMKGNELSSEGVRLRDMPEEWFALPSPEAMNNAIIAPIGVLRCSRLMDQRRFQEADDLMRDLLAQKTAIAGLSRGLMVCDRMYLELIGQNRPEALAALRTKEQERLMKAMRSLLSVLRTEYAFALLAEKDGKKAEASLRQFEKAAASSPYPGEIQAERELVDLAAQTAQSREG